MAVTGPPRAAGGRVGAARRGRCPAPLRCIEGVYSRYCKAGATLAGIGVRVGQDPFRDPQRITARAWPARKSPSSVWPRVCTDLTPQPPKADGLIRLSGRIPAGGDTAG